MHYLLPDPNTCAPESHQHTTRHVEKDAAEVWVFTSLGNTTAYVTFKAIQLPGQI
ncbi:UNVERIFIED_CONTAM: hypothetical protein FKN15_055794 [Acipenser sinensis]